MKSNEGRAISKRDILMFSLLWNSLGDNQFYFSIILSSLTPSFTSSSSFSFSSFFSVNKLSLLYWLNLFPSSPSASLPCYCKAAILLSDYSTSIWSSGEMPRFVDLISGWNFEQKSASSGFLGASFLLPLVGPKCFISR